MSDLRKAAVLLASLPQEQAAHLLGKLDPEQIVAVCIEIATLDEVNDDEQIEIACEFVQVEPNTVAGRMGGLAVTKSLIERALGSRAGNMMAKVRREVESLPFRFLNDIDPQNVLMFVTGEHPQTIALILSYLPPKLGAEILAGLPSDRQLEVIRRIATMRQTNSEIVHEVEWELQTRMSAVMGQQFATTGGVSTIAEILNVSDRATERTVLQNLAQEDPELVEEIRRLMFVFEDIRKFADRDIQTILKNIDTSQLAMALKGASEELKAKILENLSQRAANVLQEELGYLGTVKRSSVEQAQRQVVDIVRSLEDSGEITPESGIATELFVD